VRELRRTFTGGGKKPVPEILIRTEYNIWVITALSMGYYPVS